MDCPFSLIGGLPSLGNDIGFVNRLVSVNSESHNFTAEVNDLGDAMEQLQSGVGLDMNDKLFRKLY